MYTLYCHTNKINGKKYVGITSWNPRKRWNNGNGYRGNSYFYNAIQKYGWDNFEHEILFEGLSKENAEEIETTLIRVLQTTNRDKGYNIEGGGLNHKHITQETRERQSLNRIGKRASNESRQRMSIAQKNRITPEDRQRRSEIAKRLHQNPVYREKVKNALKSKYMVGQYDIYGNLIKMHESLCDAVESTGFDKSNILACFSGRQKTCKGFVWKKEYKQ